MITYEELGFRDRVQRSKCRPGVRLRVLQLMPSIGGHRERSSNIENHSILCQEVISEQAVDRVGGRARRG